MCSYTSIVIAHILCAPFTRASFFNNDDLTTSALLEALVSVADLWGLPMVGRIERTYLVTLAILLLASGPCTALRALHQADASTAATPAGPLTAPSSRALALQQGSDASAAPAAALAAAPTAPSSHTETAQQRNVGAALQQAPDGSAAPGASPAAASTAPSRAGAGVPYIQVSLCLVSRFCFFMLREEYHA